jgi:hypothetical protein
MMSKEEIVRLIVRAGGVYFLIQAALSFLETISSLLLYVGPLSLVSDYGSSVGFWSFSTFRLIMNSLSYTLVKLAVGLYLVYRGGLIYRLILRQPRAPEGPLPESHD